MKILYYDTTGIMFPNPNAIAFRSSFDESLFKYCYMKIPSKGDYQPYFDTDDFARGTTTLDVKAEFLNSGKKLPKISPKSSDKRLALYQGIIRDFFTRFPEFVGLFKNNTLLAEHSISNAQVLLSSPVTSSNFIEVKRVIDRINRTAWSREKNLSERQSGVSSLGEISETLLNLALESLVDDKNFFKVGHPDVKSYGDFVLLCLPNNLWISVKSNYGRERLIASGYSNDILGVGFFEEAAEFTSLVRIRNFQRAGFLAIYFPDVPITPDQINANTSTYEEILDIYSSRGETIPTNVNGGLFFRRLSELGSDLSDVLNETDIKKRSTVKF